MFIPLAITFCIALVAGQLFEKIKLPALIGYLLVGIFFSPYTLESLNLSNSFFGQAFLTRQITSNSSILRELALFIILFRAGLGLDRSGLKTHGMNALLLSTIPCLLEASVVTWCSHILLQLPLLESAIIGFVLAAVSPAVIVPQMLDLQKRGLGLAKKIPTLVLAGSTIDDIIAIGGFGICLSLLSTNMSEDWRLLALKIPLSVISGILIGYFITKPLASLLLKGHIKKLLYSPILLLVAFGLKELEESQAFFFSHLICILTLGVSLQTADLKLSELLSKHFAKVWGIAVVILFVLIGAMLNPNIAISTGLNGLIILAIGLTARSVGVLSSLIGSKLNIKERFFCVISYLPKATVQATVGGIALSMFQEGKIKLFEGSQTGDLIIAMAALSILVTAPIGSVGIRYFSSKLLKEPEVNSDIS